MKPHGQYIPVLMMTGLDDVTSIQHAYQVGATDFVTKPLNFTLLEFRLRYMLRAKVMGDELRQSEALLASAQRLAHLGHFAYVPARGFLTWNVQTHSVLGLGEGLLDHHNRRTARARRSGQITASSLPP